MEKLHTPPVPLKVTLAKAFDPVRVPVIVFPVFVALKVTPFPPAVKIDPVSASQFPATVILPPEVRVPLSSIWTEPSVVEEALPWTVTAPPGANVSPVQM